MSQPLSRDGKLTEMLELCDWFGVWGRVRLLDLAHKTRDVVWILVEGRNGDGDGR